MSTELEQVAEEMNADIVRVCQSMKDGMTKMIRIIDDVKLKLDLRPSNTKLTEDSADQVSRIMFNFASQVTVARSRVRIVAGMGPAYTEVSNELFSMLDTIVLKSAAVMAKVKELRA